MARQQSVSLIDDIDDIDGTKAVETVRFGLDGASYEIDLNRKHAGNLRKSLGEFVEHSRKAKPTPQHRNAKPKTNAMPMAGTVRSWATANGISVATRGRIPADLVEKYQHSLG
jgi:Lsr2